MAAKGTPPPAAYSVLVVDDEVEVRQLFSILLDCDEQFVLVGVARDGAEALEMVRDAAPDAIICDVRMPRMTGLDALPRLRRLCPDTVIVMFSADPVALRALMLGADAVLDKGTDPVKVLRDVAKLCEERRR